MSVSWHCNSRHVPGLYYMHGAAQSEDAVVCLLGPEALEGGLHNVVLFGEDVVGPVRQCALAHLPAMPSVCHGSWRCTPHLPPHVPFP
jgi:hypothetical protein